MCLSSSLLCVMSKQSLIASFTCKKYLNTIWKIFFLFSFFTEAVNRWCCILLLQAIQTNKKKNPVTKNPPPSFYIMLPLSLSLLLLPSLSTSRMSSFCLFFCLYLSLPSCPLLCPSVFLSPSLALISALLCLRELASKLSAASGLKAISSASLPLQVCGWDW